MAICDTCLNSFGVFEGSKGRCNRCRHRNFTPENYAAHMRAEQLADERMRPNQDFEAQQAKAEQAALARIMLTTEHNPSGLIVAERLGIVTAECAFGMHMFKDLFSIGRDLFGGRSETIQTTLKDARNTAFQELRAEALALGADAVIAVDLDYSEISGGGKSMLFVVASGTAVRLGSVQTV